MNTQLLFIFRVDYLLWVALHTPAKQLRLCCISDCLRCTGVTTRQHWQTDGSVELEVVAAVQSAGPAGESELQTSLPSCRAHATMPIGSLPAGTHYISARVTSTSGCVLRVLATVKYLSTFLAGCLSCPAALVMDSLSQQVCIDADVQRWWPLGYGTPRLHDLEVSAGMRTSFVLLSPQHRSVSSFIHVGIESARLLFGRDGAP